MKPHWKTILPLLIFATLTANGSPLSGEALRGSRVSWARLKFPVMGSSSRESAWDWHAHPSGDIRLIDFIRKNTTVNLKTDWNVVDVDDLEKMCAFPFLFIHGQRTQNISPVGKRNLKEYLLRVGFVFIDDCVYRKYDPCRDMLYRSMLALLQELFPEAKLNNLTPEHELFRCCFKLDALPHCQGKNNGIQSLTLNGRLIAILTSSDIHCGWVSERWFGSRITQNAWKMGANIYIYAMTH